MIRALTRRVGRQDAALRWCHGLFALAWLASSAAVAQHEDLFFGHSPPDPDVEPTPDDPCPTQAPLQLFVADNDSVGGAIPPGGGAPADAGALIVQLPVDIGAVAAQPARGGYVYGLDSPGLNFIASSNPCHGMNTSFTGGQPFDIFLQRTHWLDGTNFGMTRNVTPILLEDGESWKFGDSANGGHIHPFFLAHRAGSYVAEFRATSSIVFTPSEPFTLRFATDPKCVEFVPLDLTAVFNADVVDSDESDAPLAFDGAGHFWVLDGHYGTDRGLPTDGRLDVFQLGGPNGAGLLGSTPNGLVDDGVRSTAATVDLFEAGQAGNYEGAELLLGAAGDFTCLTGQMCEELVVTLTYATGSPQVVSVRRLALPMGVAPVFLPLNDWRISTSPPKLSVGPDGTGDGGGFARSSGTGIDLSVTPANAFYFQRVTFPTNRNRELRTIAFGNYVFDGRVGVFAVTLTRADVCRDCDFDEDGDVDLADYEAFQACAAGAEVMYADPNCARCDPDRDEDLDVRDFGAFQALFTGESIMP